MKNKFFRRAAVLTAALFSFTFMSATAYAPCCRGNHY